MIRNARVFDSVTAKRGPPSDVVVLRGRITAVLPAGAREMPRETVAYAHRRGLRVSGHVPAFLRAQDVVAMGFDEVQHINQLMLNFLVTHSTDTGTLQERGSIAVGKLADLVLVDGDPTCDIADLRKVALVITQGQLIRPAELHKALGIRPFAQDAPKVVTRESQAVPANGGELTATSPAR